MFSWTGWENNFLLSGAQAEGECIFSLLRFCVSHTVITRNPIDSVFCMFSGHHSDMEPINKQFLLCFRCIGLASLTHGSCLPKQVLHKIVIEYNSVVHCQYYWMLHSVQYAFAVNKHLYAQFNITALM